MHNFLKTTIFTACSALLFACAASNEYVSAGKKPVDALQYDLLLKDSEAVARAKKEEAFIKKYMVAAIFQNESPLSLLCRLWAMEKSACEAMGLPIVPLVENDPYGSLTVAKLRGTEGFNELAYMHGIYVKLSSRPQILADELVPDSVMDDSTYMINPRIRLQNYIYNYYSKQEAEKIMEVFPYKKMGENILYYMVNSSDFFSRTNAKPFPRDLLYTYEDSHYAYGKISSVLEGAYFADGELTPDGESAVRNRSVYYMQRLERINNIVIFSKEPMQLFSRLNSGDFFIYKGLAESYSHTTLHTFERLSPDYLKRFLKDCLFLTEFGAYVDLIKEIEKKGGRISESNFFTFEKAYGIIEEYLEKAKGGDSDAQLKVGYAYLNLKEKNEAKKWADRAIGSGRMEGYLIMGDIFLSENKTEEAFSNREIAAKAGVSRAQYLIGHMYENGTGVKSSSIHAEYWYKKAIETGDDTDAMVNLANFYFNSFLSRYHNYDYGYYGEFYRKTEELRSQAVALCEKAGMKGYSRGYRRLGIFYDYNYPRAEYEDIAKAAEYYRKAVEMGDARAMRLLAACYERGSPASPAARFLGIEDLKKDPLQAEYWYTKAAINGDKKSVEILADYYSNGNVWERDLEKAIYWKEVLKKSEKRSR